MAKEPDEEGEGPMPAWQRQKNLAEIQKLKVDNRDFHFYNFYTNISNSFNK